MVVILKYMDFFWSREPERVFYIVINGDFILDLRIFNFRTIFIERFMLANREMCVVSYHKIQRCAPAKPLRCTPPRDAADRDTRISSDVHGDRSVRCSGKTTDFSFLSFFLPFLLVSSRLPFFFSGPFSA
jgi:hypothetical protein